jgi:hypothetical protein
MNSEILIEPELLFPERRLRVFSLYVDFAAAVRARWATSQISRLAGEQWKSSSGMWDLDSLVASQPIRKIIAQDAAEADVLVIAMSSLDRREPELIQWLESLADGKVNRPVTGLFIGLFGGDDQGAGELDWTVKHFLRCAQRTDRDFIWHWMEPGVMDDGDWLAESVETLLARKQPMRETAFLPEAVLGTA